MNTQSEQPNRYAAPQAELGDVKDDVEVGQLAGRGARLGAATLDGLVWMLLIYVPFLVGAGIQGLASLGESATKHPGNPFVIYSAIWHLLVGSTGLYVLIGFVIAAALNIYFVIKNSQTVGKKLVGIKVVRTNGSKISLSRIFFLRNILGYYLICLIPFIGKIYGLADALFIFGEPRRCIHDRIADTIVVKA